MVLWSFVILRRPQFLDLLVPSFAWENQPSERT